MELPDVGPQSGERRTMAPRLPQRISIYFRTVHSEQARTRERLLETTALAWHTPHVWNFRVGCGL